MKKISIFLFLLALFIACGYFYYWYNINIPISDNSQIINFVVQKGWGSTKISQELTKAGLIRNSYVFQLYTWKNAISSRLQDGEYLLTKNLNLKEISQILSRGAGTSKEITLKFIEGWNNNKFAAYLEEKGISEQKDFFDVVQKKADWWDDYDFLNSRPKNADLEGYLFPDTYNVYRDSSISDIVRKLLDNFDIKLTSDLRQEIENQDKSIHEILTLASILEKEVSTDYDRKMVADIFYKRLKIGMPLQADSTVNYVTGKSVARSSGKDLQTDNLYNTYKYKGLPPGPICNPGMSAIIAAIYPIKNEYYYFLTTPEGKVIYSKTHDEHVAAKVKYYK